MRRTLLTTAACLLASLAANAGTIEMKVYGMVCGFCAQGIEKTLRKYPATEDVLVDLEKQLVVVTTRDGHDITDAELTKAIGDAGYDVKRIARTDRSMELIRRELVGSTR
jgi:copper chaperone CopZ